MTGKEKSLALARKFKEQAKTETVDDVRERYRRAFFPTKEESDADAARIRARYARIEKEFNQLMRAVDNGEIKL